MLDLIPYALHALTLLGLAALAWVVARRGRPRPTPTPATNGNGGSRVVRPWFRFWLTFLALLSYSAIVFRLLELDEEGMTPTVASLIGMLMQGLATAIAMAFAWWFKPDSDERPNTTAATDDHPYLAKPERSLPMTSELHQAIDRLAQQGAAVLKRLDCDQLGHQNYPDLPANIHGRPVADLQTILQELGVELAVTGSFGSDTQDALEHLIGKSDYDLHRGDLAALSDLYVQQMVKNRDPSLDQPSSPTPQTKEDAMPQGLPELPERFKQAVAPLLKKEAGFTNDPDDPGNKALDDGTPGMTMMGITRYNFPNEPMWKEIDALLAAGSNPNDLIDALTPYVEDFYFRNFWQPANCEHLPIGLDEQHLDFAVNAGKGATKAIQTLANAFCQEALDGTIDEDGLRGPTTTKAIKAVGQLGDEWTPTLVAAYKVLQGVHYLRILKAKPSQRKFIKGWLLHRLEL